MARFDLTGKVALIAGASRGIGEKTAIALAEQGAKVIVTSRKLESCSEVAKKINEAGGSARAMKLHLGELDDHETVLASIEKEEGSLDILVNNGATNPFFGPAIDTPVAAWDKTIEVNVRGPFFLTTKAAVLMKKNGGGSVINVASVNGLKPGFDQGVYSMTKAAIINITQVFAQELGADGIRVNALAPGLTQTKIAAALMADQDATAKMVDSKFSIKRVGQPTDMADAILYLASDESSYVTGHTLVVDGGLTTRGSL